MADIELDNLGEDRTEQERAEQEEQAEEEDTSFTENTNRTKLIMITHGLG